MVTLLASAISRAWPINPNPVTSVQPCTSPASIASQASRLSCNMDRDGSLHIGILRDSLLQRRRDHAGPDAFSEHQHIARARARVGQDAIRMDQASDGISELDLLVLHAVPAQQRAIGFVNLLGPALQDFRQIVQVALGRPRENRKRGDRLAAHRVNVAERVGRRDRAERVRIVDNGREEIDGLHQGALRRQLVHAGIVGGIKPDQHVFVRPAWDPGEHLVQNLWTQFGRSTGRGSLGGQMTFRCGHDTSIQEIGGPLPRYLGRLARKAFISRNTSASFDRKT